MRLKKSEKFKTDIGNKVWIEAKVVNIILDKDGSEIFLLDSDNFNNILHVNTEEALHVND